jgi:multiple sugar transport system ATP-binding protein
MRTEVKALHQRLNTTIVYVTHDQIEAMTMADKIVVMRDGVIEQIGSPLEVYDHPANLFVAQFIGSPAMNTFSGVVRTGRTPNVETADGITLPLASIPTGFNGRSVTYGIRPENIRIDPHGLAAEVVVVEPTGPEVQLTLRTGSTEFVAIFRERMPIKAGDIIFVNPDPTQCHLFDIESGSRLSVQ